MPHPLALSFTYLIAALSLGGCSIEEVDSQERTLDEDELYSFSLNSQSSLEEQFMQDCLQCVQGDLSTIQSLIQRFEASYRDPNFSEPLVLQRFNPNHLFESCAQKALQEGDKSVFDASITRPGRAARIAQRFYSAGNINDGAFWLQRVVNLQSEKDGLTTAGRIFVGHRETLAIGARLLEQAARLGSTEAAQILLGLTNPSSSYYQALHP